MSSSTASFAPSSIDPDNPPYAALRDLLRAAFTSQELRRFCQDRPLFHDVLLQFGPSDSLDDLIDELFEYCRTRLLWDELLAEVQAAYPRQYERFEQRLYGQSARLDPHNALFSGAHPQRLAAIAALLDSDDPQAVDLLLKALAENAPPSGFRRLLPGDDRRERAEMRQAIAGALGEIGDPRAVESLTGLLQDPEAGVRSEAAHALGQLGDERAVDALDKAASHDADAQVRAAAAAALTRIDPLPRVGRIFADQYEILQEMEPGGLTAAYRARDIRLERLVVLKVLRKVLDSPDFLRNFERQADAFARLRHPNLVRVLGYNVTWPRPFYDREPVGDEDTLRDLLAERGRLSLAEALPLLEQVAGVLDYLHGQEPPVFHLHLKPAHVLLAGEGDAWRAVLTDSIPTRVWQASQTDDLVGAPGYISPEMAKGTLDEIGPRTDVYGLALIAYETLTGRAPFEGHTPLAVVQAHAEEPPPSPRQFAPDLSDSVSDVLLRALSKDPQARFATAGDLVAALQEAAAPDKAEARLALPARFRDIEIDIYRTRAPAETAARLSTPLGEAQARIPLDLDAPELTRGLEALYQDTAMPEAKAKSRRRSIWSRWSKYQDTAMPEAKAKVLGQWLFDRLFAGELGRLWSANLAAVQALEEGLRLRLRIEQADLAALPWELLHDGEQFLVLRPDISLLRYTPQPEAPLPLPLTRPLRILAVSANPADQPTLDITASLQALQESLGDLLASGQVSMTTLQHATWEAVAQALQEDYHLFHFDGHGQFDDRAQSGYLVLEDEAGRAALLRPQELVPLLQPAALQLVVLNTGESARIDPTAASSGLAQALLRAGVPTVVAMQILIGDASAIAFSRGFYTALAAGYPVDLAVGQGRRAARTQAEGVGWAAPVVLSRQSDHRLVVQPQAQPEPQFWFVTANPKQYDWDRAFAAGRVSWTGVRGGEAQRNLRQMRPGDVVLAYRSTPDRTVAGLGRVTGEPYEYEDRHAVQIEMDLKLETGVSLDELRQATPDLQHVTRRRPASVSPVTAEQWAVIRELILYHNPGFGPDALPPTTVAPAHGLEIEAVELLGDLAAGQRARLTLRLRNRGNVAWPEGEQIQIACAWQPVDSESPLEIQWEWNLELFEAVPPGGLFEASDVGETVALPPGQYRTAWVAWAPAWEDAAELPRLITDIQVLPADQPGPRVVVQSDSLNVRVAPHTGASIVTRTPIGAVLEVLEDARQAMPKIGVQGQWLHVRSPDGAEGYVAAWYVSLVGHWSAAGIVGRLSTSSRRALRLAEALRQHLGADLLATEHLLWGLYQKSSGATRRLLTTFDDHEQIAPLLDALVQAPKDMSGLPPAPESALADILLTPDCQRAMEKAARLPPHDADPDGIISERHLLAGLLAVPQSRAAQWIADTLGLISAQLEFVAQEWRGREEITTLADLVRRARRTYALLLGARPQEAAADQAAEFAVGQHLYLHVDLLPGIPGSQNAFELPEGITELYCFLADAAGLHIVGSAVAALPLALLGRQLPRASFALQARLPGPRSYTVELFGEHPERGGQALAQAGGQVAVVAPQAGKRLASLQPILDLRVAAKPDLVLLVETALPEGQDGPRQLTYRLTCRLPGLRRNNEEVGQVTLQPADLSHIRTLVHQTVAATTGLQPEDVRAKVCSLGRYLFDRLFPADEAAAFRETLWQAQAFWQSHERPGQLPPTWLIVQEEATWLPWEMVTPYRLEDEGPVAPLAELYRLGRWVEGLGQTLYGEVPLGDKVLTHYKVLTPEQARQDEELLAWQRMLDVRVTADSLLPVLKPGTNFYGLHVLRHADQMGRTRDIMVRAGTLRRTSAEDEAQRRRLDLHLQRPVVTLSILDGQGSSPEAAGDDWLLPERVLPFLRAGASAVLGPWWPTSEAADREFWATFYGYLAGRMPLGEAAWRARHAVQRKFPDRPDWLAYTLLGDPRARPYVPEKSEGYTALECLNAEDDGTLRPGKTYTFRASIQRRPPVWYQNRIVETEPLPEQARARFIPLGLREPQEFEMTSDEGRTLLQATMELAPTTPGDCLLMVQLFDGQDLLTTLQLTLEVRDLLSGGQDG